MSGVLVIAYIGIHQSNFHKLEAVNDMDSLEAVRSLDGFSEILISMSILLGSKIFENKSDNQVRKDYEGLRDDIEQKQKDARWLVLEITKEIQTVQHRSAMSGDVIGVGAAVQRYVLADAQASEALTSAGKPGEETLADSIAKFRKKHGMID